jgi:hypothetical protein
MQRTRVDLALLHILPIPLTDTRAASVGKHKSANSFESTNLTITLNCSAYLLRTGCDREFAFDLKSVGCSLLGDRCRARHVLVRRVSAGTDKSDLEFLGPIVLLDFLGEFGNGSREIWGEGTIDMRFELRQVLQGISSKMDFCRKVKGVLTISITWSYSAFKSARKLCANCCAYFPMS